MSFPERQVSLSLDAQDDLTDILLHGVQEWGEAQSDRFAATIERALDDLARYPEIGERRPDLFTGCRARLMSPYIVYYQVSDNTIEIVRILHEKADLSRAAGEAAPPRLPGGYGQVKPVQSFGVVTTVPPAHGGCEETAPSHAETLASLSRCIDTLMRHGRLLVADLAVADAAAAIAGV